MSKKRKTRKEKMRTTVRQSTVLHDTTPVYSIDSSIKSVASTETHAPVHNISTTRQYAYVLHDARQTGIITSLLVAASLILYFTVQNNIINLSALGY